MAPEPRSFSPPDFADIIKDNSFHNALSIWMRRLNENSYFYREEDQGPRLDHLTFLTAEILNGERFSMHDLKQKIEFAPWNSREAIERAVIEGPGFIPFMFQTMGMTLYKHVNPQGNNAENGRQLFQELEKIFAGHCKSREPLPSHIFTGYTLAAAADMAGWLPKTPNDSFLMPSLIPQERRTQLRPNIKAIASFLR